MIAASLVVAFLVGGLLGRLHSFVALLAVSPLLALVTAMTTWSTTSHGFEAALLGLCGMVLSQAGYLAGVALDPRAGFFGKASRAPSQKREFVKGYRSASKR